MAGRVREGTIEHARDGSRIAVFGSPKLTVDCGHDGVVKAFAADPWRRAPLSAHGSDAGP